MKTNSPITKKLPSLSVFFPAYNEAGNIEEVIKQALEVVPCLAQKYEIIVVNDGSRDATRAIAERMARANRHVRVVSQRNKGYGGALKRGFSEAKYEWVFFTDADLQFDISELKRFVNYAQDHDMVLGYRSSRAEGWKRDVLARALKLWNRLFLVFPGHVKDIDGAFKLLNRKVIDGVLPLYSDGAMVSTELLLKAHRKGFVCKQLGVKHYKRRVGSPTGNSFKVILKAVRDTFVLQKLLIFNAKPVRGAALGARDFGKFSKSLVYHLIA